MHATMWRYGDTSVPRSLESRVHRLRLADQQILYWTDETSSWNVVGLCDDAFYQAPEEATHRRYTRSWCLVYFSTRPRPDRTRQDA